MTLSDSLRERERVNKANKNKYIARKEIEMKKESKQEYKKSFGKIGLET